MSTTERLKFFRKALALCVKWQRSPQLARVIGGRPQTLRQVMLTVAEGDVPPPITEEEARMLAVEFEFGYTEILAGLSEPQPRRGRSARASRPRRRGRAQALATA